MFSVRFRSLFNDLTAYELRTLYIAYKRAGISEMAAGDRRAHLPTFQSRGDLVAGQETPRQGVGNTEIQEVNA